MQIVWLDDASEAFDEVIDYCDRVWGEKVSRNFYLQIMKDTALLKENPYMGMSECKLLHREKEYRSLVEGDYKIIYYIEGEIIYITALWDCRQEPCKLTKIIK